MRVWLACLPELHACFTRGSGVASSVVFSVGFGVHCRFFLLCVVSGDCYDGPILRQSVLGDFVDVGVETASVVEFFYRFCAKGPNFSLLESRLTQHSCCIFKREVCVDVRKSSVPSVGLNFVEFSSITFARANFLVSPKRVARCNETRGMIRLRICQKRCKSVHTF